MKNMKNIILNALKRCKWIILFEIIFIIINILLTTYPAKIIGEIIDLMYNMDELKNVIIQKSCEGKSRLYLYLREPPLL